MPNRFARRIRIGELGSVEELKSEFKALAKLAHPDLAAPGASGGEFSALRAEYEDALRDFVSLRYGGPAAESGPGLAHDRGALYAELSRLAARGFPKAPRHEKERQRYERERYLARSRLRAWDEDYPELLDDFEGAMLALKAAGEDEAFDEALALFASILEYHASGVEHARTVARLDFARFCAQAGGAARGETMPASDANRGALRDFLKLLVDDMGLGPALAKARSKEGP